MLLDVGLWAIYISLFCFLNFSTFSLRHLCFLYNEKARDEKAQRDSCALCCSLFSTAGKLAGSAPSGAFGGDRERCSTKVWKQVFPVLEAEEKRNHGSRPHSPGNPSEVLGLLIVRRRPPDSIARLLPLPCSEGAPQSQVPHLPSPAEL